MAGVSAEMERVELSNEKFCLVGVTSLEFWIFEMAVAVMLLVTSSLKLFDGELDGELELEEFKKLALLFTFRFEFCCWSRTFRPARNNFSFNCLVILAISTLFKIFCAMTSSLDMGDVSFDDAQR